MQNFTQFQLSEPIEQALAKLGYTSPTEVQQKVLPAALLILIYSLNPRREAARRLPLLSRSVNR